MLSLIGRWWRRRNRQVDAKILFPIVFEQVGRDPLRFLRVIRIHTTIDPNWRFRNEWECEECAPGRWAAKQCEIDMETNQ